MFVLVPFLPRVAVCQRKTIRSYPSFTSLIPANEGERNSRVRGY